MIRISEVLKGYNILGLDGGQGGVTVEYGKGTYSYRVRVSEATEQGMWRRTRSSFF